MRLTRLSREDGVYALSLALASLIAYVATTYSLEPLVGQANDLLGGIWATVATVFVFKQARDQRLRAGIDRFFATCVSFVLTLIYLLLLPFSPAGMAAVIGIGALIVIGLGRRDDVILTTITTVVIMVVAGIGPASAAWTVPLLRLFETVIGIVIGLAFWWIAAALFSKASRRVARSAKQI